jgi:hypothetical protein
MVFATKPVLVIWTGVVAVVAVAALAANTSDAAAAIVNMSLRISRNPLRRETCWLWEVRPPSTVKGS